MIPLPGGLNDIRMFDPAGPEWRDLSGAVYGLSGPRRSSPGFATAKGIIYLHGGDSSEGKLLA